MDDNPAREAGAVPYFKYALPTSIEPRGIVHVLRGLRVRCRRFSEYQLSRVNAFTASYRVCDTTFRLFYERTLLFTHDSMSTSPERAFFAVELKATDYYGN
jgi:hypothetical protein